MENPFRIIDQEDEEEELEPEEPKETAGHDRRPEEERLDL